MASPSLIAASRACFALSASFFSYQTVPNPETRQRVGNEAGRIGGSDVLLLERAISGRRFRAWAAGVSLLALLLCLGAQAFSQTCSTSCTGLCLQQTTCGGSGTTSVSGTVYAPNGTTPLPNVLVYVPNGGPTPSYGVTAFPAGVSCGVTASGCPMVSAVTATNGTFTLTNMPVGTDIPLVIQAGKWRRKISIPNVTACANTVLTAAQTSLPTVEGQGDVADNIPYIAVVTGEVDAAECVLLKMGVAQSQFTNPSGGGRINFYLGAADGGTFSGEEIDASTPGEAALFASQASVDAYDLLMFPCQGSPTDAVAESSTNLAYLGNYANAGGHIYATHYSYQWLYTNPAFANTVNWSVGQTPPSPDPQTGYVNTSYPQGAQLAQWLKDVGASTVLGQIPLSTLRKDQNGVLGSTLSVLTIDYPSAADPTVMQLTFNTPLTAAPANQCGQVLYNEYHVFEEGDDHGDVFPAACTTGPLSPQEQLLAFSLFGLSTVVSAEPSPTVAVSITNSPAEFVQGDPADTLTINVSNTSTTSPTNPSLTLTAVLPAGLTVANMVGSTPTSGWTCNTGTLTCTRTTGLSASTSDAITLTVSVAGNLAAGSLETVSATASGGGIASSATGQDKVLIAGQTGIAVTNVNPASEDYGNTAPVTITAVLTWAGSGPAPTGTVSIGGSGFSGIFGATTCGSASGNTITCASTYTPSGTDLPGSYTVAASFTGDSNYTGSNSPQTGNFTIAPATTTTTVTSGTNPSVFGQSVILTASIAGEFGMARQGSPALAGERLTKGRLAKGARTKGAIARGELTKGESSRSGAIAGMQLDVSGSVTWSANTGCGTTPATSGNPAIATCTTSSLLVGDDAITATYLGDSDHGGSSGTLSNQVVSPASAAATVSSSLNPSTYGQAVSFGVSVAAVAPGAGTPTGTVQFAVDGTNLGSAVTLVGGSASSGSIATLAEGTHSVTATYTGDGNFQ
ncbi:MAG: Ig-like domain-containing protein, partial [Terriglobales bacterium]